MGSSPDNRSNARRSIEDIRRAAEERLVRLSPSEAFEAAGNGAVLVDVRSEEERRLDGVIPGALHHPLSVLHWRLDPDIVTHNEKLPLDTHVILICREGFSSVLAAVLSQELGFARATDVIGGVNAWSAAGLPVGHHDGHADGGR